MKIEIIDKEDCADRYTKKGHKRYNDIIYKNKKTRGCKRCFICGSMDNGSRGHSWYEYFDHTYGRLVRHYLCYQCRLLSGNPL